MGCTLSNAAAETSHPQSRNDTTGTVAQRGPEDWPASVAALRNTGPRGHARSPAGSPMSVAAAATSGTASQGRTANEDAEHVSPSEGVHSVGDDDDAMLPDAATTAAGSPPGAALPVGAGDAAAANPDVAPAVGIDPTSDPTSDDGDASLGDEDDDASDAAHEALPYRRALLRLQHLQHTPTGSHAVVPRVRTHPALNPTVGYIGTPSARRSSGGGPSASDAHGLGASSGLLASMSPSLGGTGLTPRGSSADAAPPVPLSAEALQLHRRAQTRRRRECEVYGTPVPAEFRRPPPGAAVSTWLASVDTNGDSAAHDPSIALAEGHDV
uniref:Uncharacterized protein n=1 Tax=Neobodo designis TaxID=312471 RepID=A0A7S1MEL0_NEODS|eukprot:CAMPEP_0174856666 /NCGR_PEP_ID=MMETSP1114-20130205/36157_1 /TAXON_ID=312471 /ORGANISM="Neobodo designis, Strain CCAP 1951/1" /LENGTH=325 /DNA_ID=CAMNT_0016091471 /DNA_START=143 /DNA_END=1120 /DNA_ORIENTATION=+